MPNCNDPPSTVQPPTLTPVPLAGITPRPPPPLPTCWTALPLLGLNPTCIPAGEADTERHAPEGAHHGQEPNSTHICFTAFWVVASAQVSPKVESSHVLLNPLDFESPP